MSDIDVEWEDVQKKVEEDEFKDAKKKQYDKEAKTASTDKKTDGGNVPKQPDNKEFEAMGLAGMIAEIWNEVGGEKGYEEVTDRQIEFLNKRSARFEKKYLEDRTNILPEIELALSHAVVYVPKWLKHRRQNRGKSNEA